nr:HAD family hydrolase [uncultured Carboxylicivirga sp.]
MNVSSIKVIGFDADDTLWENETFFREAEHQFATILSDFMKEEDIMHQLYEIEMANMPIYGYGIKAFILSLIETGCRITNDELTAEHTSKILAIGKEMLNKPVELLNGVTEVLDALSQKYKLIVATKGDLLDQERKLAKSGLLKYFHHIEVMSDKHPQAYQKLIKHLDVQPSEFLMIGNSMKSDVLPVEEIGGYGIHVPFHVTWHHEVVEHQVVSDRVIEVEQLKDVLKLFTAEV